MSFLLCHECYTWVEPSHGRCSGCQQTIDPALPDPPLHALEAAIGPVVRRIGRVRVRRKLLPDCGTLYATTGGLYFLPHRLEQVPQLVEAPAGSSSLFWSVAAMIWFPLVFVLPFIRPRTMERRLVPVLQPQWLPEGEGRRLPELLMQNPGVFFVPGRSIRCVQRRWGKWTVDRSDGPPIRFKPETDADRLDERFAELAQATPWGDVVVG
jgi:hypothetical protein